MMQRLANKEDAAAALRTANGQRTKVGALDLSALNRVLQHTPEDMTVTVESGVTLAELQAALGRRGQWLPIDPVSPERTTVAVLLSENLSGPRRYGFGTIRDHLIGLEVALADGRLIHSGGKVVKNVAGFDLLKLFVGARNTLGFVVEATFKLLPLPASEYFVQSRSGSLEDCRRVIDAALDSELTPAVLDCFNLDDGQKGGAVVLGFSGTYDEVDWQLSRASGLGFTEPATLDYERQFWMDTPVAPQCVSVLPSRLTAALRDLQARQFVARAGNGVIYHRSGLTPPQRPEQSNVFRRVKDIFDPHHILPELFE
jgi:FAD/FMN-containing dehydrogenase